MPERIVQEIGDHLGQQFLVAGHRQLGPEMLDERLSLLLRGRLERFDRVACDPGEIERLERRQPGAGLDLADAQKRAEHLEHAFDFDDRGVDRLPDRGGRGVPPPRGFQPAQNAGERLA